MRQRRNMIIAKRPWVLSSVRTLRTRDESRTNKIYKYVNFSKARIDVFDKYNENVSRTYLNMSRNRLILFSNE